MGTKTKAELELEIKKLKEEQKQKLENKFTTTKKILWLSWILFIALIVVTACGIETGMAMEIVGGVVTAVTTLGYLWKARLENKIKITLSMLDELENRENLSEITSMLEVLFKND